MYLEPQL